jgi:hypothetical protein
MPLFVVACLLVRDSDQSCPPLRETQRQPSFEHARANVPVNRFYTTPAGLWLCNRRRGHGTGFASKEG